MAKEQDVADIINLYNDFFNNSVDDDDADPIIDAKPPLSIPFGDSGDSGVEVELSMTPEQLAHNLGFRTGLPILFNDTRHTGGLTPWRAATRHLFQEKDILRRDPAIVPLTLHWHQLAGIHAIIRKLFTAEAATSSEVLGVLIADEVGLGKTFQIATTISFLIDLVHCQANHLPLPPIISKLVDVFDCNVFLKNSVHRGKTFPW